MKRAGRTRRSALGLLGTGAAVLGLSPWLRAASGMAKIQRLLAVPDLVCLWDFCQPTGERRFSHGPYWYDLREGSGPVERREGGPLSGYAAELREGQYFTIPRKECPALDLHGAQAQVTVVAWVQRARKSNRECEAVAGMWNESRGKRQYGLFLNLSIDDSADQAGGHVSSTGGPTPGYSWSIEASIGQTIVPYDTWQCVGFTYDGQAARSYLNGVLDLRPDRNPYAAPGGICDGGKDGADFTVGAVDRAGEMGNFFAGLLGGLVVFCRALSDQEMAAVHGVGAQP